MTVKAHAARPRARAITAGVSSVEPSLTSTTSYESEGTVCSKHASSTRSSSAARLYVQSWIVALTGHEVRLRGLARLGRRNRHAVDAHRREAHDFVRAGCHGDAALFEASQDVAIHRVFDLADSAIGN